MIFPAYDANIDLRVRCDGCHKGVPRARPSEDPPQLPQQTHEYHLYGQHGKEETQAHGRLGDPANQLQDHSGEEGERHETLGDQTEVTHPARRQDRAQVMALLADVPGKEKDI